MHELKEKHKVVQGGVEFRLSPEITLWFAAFEQSCGIMN